MVKNALKLDKKMNIAQLNELSFNIRENIIESVNKNGGHFSSNLGNVESVIAIHYCFNLPTDKLIFDVGHQSYTHKILSGLSLENLRKSNGINGFQDNNESDYDIVDGGHSSTSISQANALAYLRDSQNQNYQIICYIGDASFENGLIYESLFNLSKLNTKIIIILNDNNMSISKTPENFATFLKNHELLKQLFRSLNFDYIYDIDGHDFNQLIKAYNQAKLNTKTTIVHINTIKGKGFNFAENDKIGYYHKVNNIDKENPILSNRNNNLLCQIAADFLIENIEKDAIVVNPATTISSNLVELSNALKDRFFDVGMAEEYAGVFAGTYGQFKHSYLFINSSFSQRMFDQIIHDISRKNSHCTILLDKVGLMGGDGETHQGIYDLSFLNSIPNLKIVTPSKKEELINLLKYSQKNKESLVIRLFAEPIKEATNNEKFLLKDNEAILSNGLQIETLKNNFEGIILKSIYQKPFSIENEKSTEKLDTIFVYDTASTNTGFFSICNNYLSSIFKGKIINVSLPDKFIKYGTVKEQIDKNNVSIEHLKKVILENRK